MAGVAGKAVLITGGGSGVGQAAAQLFAEAGAKVAIAGRDEAKLKKAAEGLSGVFVKACDVTDPDCGGRSGKGRDRETRPNRHPGEQRRHELKARRMRELTVENWNQLVRTNLDGAFYCIREVLPQMLERKDGVDHQRELDLRQAGLPAGGAGYAAGEVRHARPGRLPGRRGSRKRHPREQHLSRARSTRRSWKCGPCR